MPEEKLDLKNTNKAVSAWKGVSTPIKVAIFGGSGFVILSCCICCGGATGSWYFGFWTAKADYFPLHDGAKWEYDFEYRLGLQGAQKGNLVRRVDGKELINGKSYFKVTSAAFGIPGMDAQTDYLRRDEKGTHLLSKDREREDLILPEPIEVGKEWTITREGKQERIRIEGKEDVHLIDKVYKGCVKVQTISNDGEATTYYAPDVGVVKTVSSRSVQGIEVNSTRTLKKHTR
jgi:hypothetical protein